MPEDDSTPIYLIAGHGSESFVPFGKRHKVPPGCTVVLFTQCAVPLYTVRTCKISDFIRNPKNRMLLLNPEPEILSSFLGDIRIYKEGDRLPYIIASLTAEHDHDSTNSTAYYKAGVYKSPEITTVDRKKFPLDVSGSKEGAKVSRCYKYMVASVPKGSVLSEEMYHEIYRGAVFKPKYDYVLSNKSHIELTNIINAKGKGVYYFAGCRSLTADFPSDMYEQMFKTIMKKKLKDSTKILQKQIQRSQKANQRFMNKLQNIENVSPSSSPVSSPSPFDNLLIEFDKNLEIDKSHINNIHYLRDYKKALEKILKDESMSPTDKAEADRLLNMINSVNPNLYKLFDQSEEQQKKYRKA